MSSASFDQSTDLGIQRYNYNSLTQRYNGNQTPDLQLKIRDYGQNAIEIELKNLQYTAQKRQKIKYILTLLIVYVAYSLSISKGYIVFNGHVLCNIFLILWILQRLLTLSSIIQTENIIFCLDLAIQCRKVRFWRTENLYIPASNIYDLVINEVIEDLDVHYVLIIRTKGNLFQKKPIITLFNSSRPTCECLEMIYKCINAKMQNTSLPM